MLETETRRQQTQLTGLARFGEVVERSPEFGGLDVKVFDRMEQVVHNPVHHRFDARVAFVDGAVVDGLQ